MSSYTNNNYVPYAYQQLSSTGASSSYPTGYTVRQQFYYPSGRNRRSGGYGHGGGHGGCCCCKDEGGMLDDPGLLAAAAAAFFALYQAIIALKMRRKKRDLDFLDYLEISVLNLQELLVQGNIQDLILAGRKHLLSLISIHM